MYLFGHQLAIEVDEKGYNGRDEHKEIEKQKAIAKKLDCRFLRIYPDEKDFDMDI